MASQTQSGVEASGSRGGNAGQSRLKLRALGVQELPPHPALAGAQDETSPALDFFLKEIFQEAKTEYLQSFSKIGTFGDQVAAGGEKVSISVDKLKFTAPGEKDTWFARRSTHDEGSEPNVKFEEWDGCVRVAHAMHEGEYDPSIYDVNCVLKWEGVEVEGMREVNMSINQMYHTMPWPLNGRLFNQLVITGVRADVPASAGADEVTLESIIIQIPVIIGTLPEALRSNTHDQASGKSLTYNPPEGAPAKQQSQKGKKLVVGEYVAVEKISKIGSVTRWDMKTASNAKGWLPRWVQNMGVAGAVAKDVGFGLNWILKRRAGEGA